MIYKAIVLELTGAEVLAILEAMEDASLHASEHGWTHERQEVFDKLTERLRSLASAMK
jgi:hypothetical protein